MDSAEHSQTSKVTGRYHLVRVDDAEHTPEGKMAGRYLLTRLIGHGGMGEVWQATDIHLKRQVAIKLLPAVKAGNREYLDEFVNEARSAAMLEHPHILALHDFGEQEMEDGEVVPYLVMPYVAGGTLRKRMQAANGVLSVQHCLYFLKQAALAIDYAHSKQVLHRDIKPENMLLQQDWLLLADFGLAKILSNASIHAKTHAHSGTPAYMAPERIQGQVGPSGDLYSLAVIAYQLFTGKQPFSGETPIQIFMQHMEATPTAPRQLNSNIPPEVERVILQGLSRQPQERPASCNAFVDALQQGWEGSEPVQQDMDSTLLGPLSKRWQTAPHTPLETPVLVSTDANYLTPSKDDSGPALPTRSTVELPDSVESPLTPVPLQKVTQKFGRRQMLVGGVAVAALAAAGVTTTVILHNRSTQVSRLPTPGPHKLIAGIPMLSLNAHTDEVWVAKWHPSGRYLVTAGADRNIMLWDITSILRDPHHASMLTTPLKTWSVAGIQFTDTNGGLCWSPNGKQLIFPQSFGDKIYVLDVFAKTSTPVIYSNEVRINTNADLIYNEVCPGPLLGHFSVTSENFVEIWRLGQTASPEKTVYCDKNLNILNISKLNWSHDGSILAALFEGDDDHLRAAFWRSGQLAAHITNMPARSPHYTFFRMADTIAWSPTEPHLLLLSNADMAVIADLQKQVLALAIGVLNNTAAPVLSGMSWSPNGRYIVGSYCVLGDNNTNRTIDPHIYIWDTIALRKNVSPTAPTVNIQSPTLSFGQQGALQHTDTIVDVQWSPDGRYLATASLDHKVMIWKVDGA